MALTKEDLQQIEDHIKSNISSWIGDTSLTKSSYFNEMELLERIVRVEEELKNQRELMQTGFQQSDKRFEDMQKHIDRRFEQVDKRFEDVNSKFTMMFVFMTLGFTILAVMMTVFKFLA